VVGRNSGGEMEKGKRNNEGNRKKSKKMRFKKDFDENYRNLVGF
jgi:hypothetical protein